MPRQLAFDLPHRPHFTREDFLVAEANRHAVTALDAFSPSGEGGVLALSGPGGCGKTHLAHIWASRTGARWIVRTALAASLREIAGLPAMPMAFDAADTVCGHSDDEAALFHLLNLVRQQGSALLIVGRQPPSRWPVRLADLKSRLAALDVAAIGAPDEALLGAVLVKLFADRQMTPPAEVIAYLLARMDRSLDFARRTVSAIDAAALAGKRAITVPLAARVLAGLQEGNDEFEGE